MRYKFHQDPPPELDKLIQRERLWSVWDVAAELAGRDHEIQKLRAEIFRLKMRKTNDERLIRTFDDDREIVERE